MATKIDQYLGRTFGPYRVEAALGEGASGHVYRARHLHLDRAVALKILSAGSGTLSEKDEQRFEREAKAAARLQNPNVARVFDFGSQDGLSFLAQEFVEGQNLAQRLKGGEKLPLSEGLGLGAALAAGLHAIHKADLVHRDLKPGNIIVTPGGEAKIVDFGLVRVLDDSLHSTDPGSLMGTPYYMSPEQIGIVPDAIGPAADIFALGCVLCHALTGRIPHDTGGKSLREFLRRRASEVAVDPRVWRPDLPEEVAAVIQRSLELDPAKRPSARDVQRTLQAAKRALAGVPTAEDAQTRVLGDLELEPSEDAPTAPALARGTRQVAFLWGVAALGCGLVFAMTLAVVGGLRSPKASTVQVESPTPSISDSISDSDSDSDSPASDSDSDSASDSGSDSDSAPASASASASGSDSGSDSDSDSNSDSPASASPSAALDAALAALEDLQLSEASALLDAVKTSPAEVTAARQLLTILQQLNASDRLVGEPRGPLLDALDKAPRTAALIRAWEPGLTTYGRARAAAERRNPLGIMFHFGAYTRTSRQAGLDANAEEARFLRPERRGEFKLLRTLATLPLIARRNPRDASTALDMILDSPPGQTPLGQSLAPWLRAWRGAMDRRADRR